MVTKPYPQFVKLDHIPWTEWVMPGVDFKLLNVDKRTGGFTCLLRVGPDNTAPIHKHLGGIELIVLEGEIMYEDSDIGTAGDYMYEPAGDVHRPMSPKGCTLFCVFLGPIAGLNEEDGSVAGIVDANVMIDMATDAGAISHVPL